MVHGKRSIAGEAFGTGPSGECGALSTDKPLGQSAFHKR